MKKLKVSIQDEHTLVLQQDGAKGDLIDLSSLHDVDIDTSTIKGVVNSIKKDVFNAEVEKVRKTIEREKELETKLIEQEKKAAIELAEANAKKASQENITKKDSEIAKLQSQIEIAQTEKKLAVTEALKVVEKERDQLTYKLDKKDSEVKILETSIRKEYEDKLKTKEEMIEYYKDMKLKLSTKMLGETLEQHCEIEFNKLRTTAFPNAYFEKDNDGKTGSKGDYIFRESDSAGNEIISIMFEMKNEGDETATKNKNEDFLPELDKDRLEKKCEYAVLVTLLETENELYNSGIVDVSYKHPKMYVVRPQFFIPIITVLRNAALNSMKYRSELALIRSQNIDITSFENELQLFQDGFMKNVKDSSNKFQEAMDGIDTTIKKLEGVKEALRLSNKHLLTAGNKVETVSVKRLTKDNPTMATKFADLTESKSK
jgi:hypothetical protein